jgi:hypothetical protein
MTTLTEANFDLLKKYHDLLETIEEAFDYVRESFVNDKYTHGDQVFADIIDALAQIHRTNQQMAAIFSEDDALTSIIQSFEAVLTELFKLESHMHDHTKKQHILQHHVFPAFEAWHLSLQPFLKKYIQQ